MFTYGKCLNILHSIHSPFLPEVAIEVAIEVVLAVGVPSVGTFPTFPTAVETSHISPETAFAYFDTATASADAASDTAASSAVSDAASQDPAAVSAAALDAATSIAVVSVFFR